MGLFDGLESLGFSEINEEDIFELPHKKNKEKKGADAQDSPMDLIYPKEFTCPVCDKTFVNFVVKKSKLRMASVDTDMRITYHTVDPVRYDVLLCGNCGYAAALSSFNRVTDKQIEAHAREIRPRFSPKEYPVPLSVEHAIERYKMALFNAVAMGLKSGEKAILCLKIAWMYRETGDKENEMLFMRNAFSGLKRAYETENFPIGTMDQNTAQFMIAEMARRLGEYEEALRVISALVVRRDIPKKLKERAIDMKEMIRAARQA